MTKPAIVRIGALGVCVLIAMTGSALTASAQDGGTSGTSGPATSTSAAGDASTAGATPPPLPAGWQPPHDNGGPDETYELGNQACVQSLSNGKIVLANRPWGQDRLRIDEAQKFTKGAGITVAVIDTGVNRHPYLGTRLSGGGDYVKKEDNGLEDCDGHGTEVAGIIAADTPSNIGFKGVAPEAKILSIRQSSALYQGPDTTSNGTNAKRPAGTLETLAQAVVHAANAGVQVINMSVDNCRDAGKFEISQQELHLQAALRYAVDQKDVVVVSSAGNLNERNCPGQNNGPDPNKPNTIVLPPWFSEDVISVAAMTRNGDPANFSMHGPWVTVAAPGAEITSLDPATDGLANQTVINGDKREIDGTSFAAPYVAGVVALVRARYPHLSARQVMRRVALTAQHPAAPTGRDDVVGYGMVNPVAALTTYIPAEDGVPPAKPGQLPVQLPPADNRDWAPMQVALIGTGGGIGLLLMTLFVVHTIRRNRRPHPARGR